MKIYLCIPYSFNPELSFEVANKVAADLMKQGHVVFSPISHSHHIADYLPAIVKTDADWWMEQDLPFVDWCDETRFVCIGDGGFLLIEESSGCQSELKRAREQKKPVKYIYFYE